MLNFTTIKAVTLTAQVNDGRQKERTYIQVDKTVKGLEGKEIFHRQINYHFIDILANDELLMKKLNEMIPAEDNRPIIFDVVYSAQTAVDRVHELNLTRFATLFGSKEWRGVIADYHGEAWLVFCTNNHY